MSTARAPYTHIHTRVLKQAVHTPMHSHPYPPVRPPTTHHTTPWPRGRVPIPYYTALAYLLHRFLRDIVMKCNGSTDKL